jgi:D-alanyl-D-alanine carboxypeptidase/D-alanyl-D-alanine-endopeptidase (penicillin-binding protein 4)
MQIRQVIGRLALPLVPALLALGAWQAADRADFDTIETTPTSYDRTLGTQMLSARRIPRTLQAPISEELAVQSVDRIIANAGEQPACVAVRDGDRLLGPAREVEGGLIPASNQKVLTTWAALEVLGPDFTFTTSVHAPVAPVGGVIDGDLYLIGSGDPFLYTDQWLSQYPETSGRFHTRLEDLADAVAGAGITEITGGVVGDESLFDQIRSGPWANRLIQQRQSGPLSALVVNEGFVDWPAEFQASQLRRPTTDPAVHAASLFGQLLNERGITIAGAGAAGQTPPGAIELAAVVSPPLTDIVTHINSYSSNIGAELVLKRTALEDTGIGSTEAGAASMVNLLLQRGLPLDDVQVFDGSGLSESNRLTCSLLVAVLAEAGLDSDLGRSLSVAGVRGSLEQRFVDSPADGRVVAKTGTLQGVRALTGFVLSAVPEAEGRYLTFAQILNDDVVETPDMLAVQEPLMDSLTTYPAGPTIAQLSPLPTEPTG